MAERDDPEVIALARDLFDLLCYPGAAVIYIDDDGAEMRTVIRSHRWTLDSGQDVVLIKGMTGGVSCDRIRPINPQPKLS
jgi:hypothetical protein